ALKNVTTPEKPGKNLVFISGTTLAYCHGKKAFSAAAFRTARHWQADGGRYNLIDSSNGARNDELRFVRSGRFFLFQIKEWFHAPCYVHGAMRDYRQAQLV